MADQPVKSGRGGRRAGAGRKRKGAVAASSLSQLDVQAALAAEEPTEVESLAQPYLQASIASLGELVVACPSEAVRVTAANIILDRGFGKPAVDVGGETLPLFGPAPDRALAQELRRQARKLAPLAIKALVKIALTGEKGAAKANAAKSLLDRGIGTVGTAKVDDPGVVKPLGKKEEILDAARRQATGRFAPPAPPRHIQH